MLAVTKHLRSSKLLPCCKNACYMPGGNCLLTSPLCSASNEPRFPWRQDFDHGAIPNDPFLHKFVGLLLLRRAAKNQGSVFDIQDFSAGIEVAVKAIGGCLLDNDPYNRLENYVGKDLYTKLRKALGWIEDEGLAIDMEIASVRPVTISRARLICGDADPGDEEVVQFLGQRVIISKQALDEVAERGQDGTVSSTFKEAKVIGAAAVLHSMRFQLDVKLATTERFYIFDPANDSKVLQGMNKLRKVHHLWRLETSINPIGYPLDWRVIDMDHLCDPS